MDLFENLEKLNFSKLEAQIYTALLGSSPMSAYQLGKKIEIARPSIYNALEHMLEKGMVELIPEQTALYKAQEPQVILDRIQSDTLNALNEARIQLKEYEKEKLEDVHFVFKGFDTAIFKVKEMLMDAKQQVYINADFDLTYFEKELQMLRENSIQVIAFSFYNIDVTDCKLEFYSHYRKVTDTHVPSRLMVVVDDNISLIADGNKKRESWKGVVSNDPLWVKILSEHIHNDIYLLKLRDKYGKEIYEDGLLLNTAFEKRQKEAL